MSENQEPENKSPDPRWIMLRISRINLGVIVAGALLAFPVMFWIGGMPAWVRISLLLALALSMASDLRLVLLKGRDSVGAFYLFELDPAAPGAAPGKQSTDAAPAGLGIRIRLANSTIHLVSPERDGVVLRGAFVSPWFTALRYRLPGDAAWRRWWPRVIPLWSDSVDAEEFRKIRVALKWK